MAARGAFTDGTVPVDYWLRNTPPGGPLDGDIALVGPAPTGVWATHAGELAIYSSLVSAYRFVQPSATPGLRGCTFFVKDGSSPDVHKYFGHDGTSLIGPFADKAYVDMIAAGLKWKAPVRVATTANGTLASAFENGDTVDGVALVTGDRILLKNQSSATENGIYTVNASGAPTRATDADSGAELVQAAVFVMEGTANADRAFVCTNNSITLGATSITFVTFTSALGALLASNNLSDLGSALTARSNLSVYSSAETDTAIATAIDARVASGTVVGALAEWDGTKWQEISPPAANDLDYVLVSNRSSGSGVISNQYVLRSAI